MRSSANERQNQQGYALDTSSPLRTPERSELYESEIDHESVFGAEGLAPEMPIRDSSPA